MTILSREATETFKLLQILCKGHGYTCATDAWISKRRGLSKYTTILHIEALKADGWIRTKKNSRMTRQIFVEHGDLVECADGCRLDKKEKTSPQRPLFEVRHTREWPRIGTGSTIEG